MNSKSKSLFYGDDDDIYEMHKIEMIRSTGHDNSKFVGQNIANDELSPNCNQIFNSFKISNKENLQIEFDLEPLKEIVDNLSNVKSKILEINIRSMINLKMQDFIVDIISKICDEHCGIDYDILTYLVFLVSIWSNGTNNQIECLFNPNFIKYLFNLAQTFFIQNSQIVDYCLTAIRNLLNKSYFRNEEIPEIMSELLFLLGNFIDEVHSDMINVDSLKSASCVFDCFRPITQNHLRNKQFQKMDQTKGLIGLIKKWIDFIQGTFFKVHDPSNFDLNDEDQIDEDIYSESVCFAIYCMNDIVKLMNDTANFYFDRKFMLINLINYLKSYNVNLKKAGLQALKCSLTVIGFKNFTAWDYIDEKIWAAISSIVHRPPNNEKDDADLKICLSKSVSSILGYLRSIIQNDQDDGDMESNDSTERQQIVESGNNSENEEEEEFIEHSSDDDDDKIVYKNEIILSSLYGHIMEFFEKGVLSDLLSLSDNENEPVGVRIEATLAIAKNISIFGLTELGYLVHAGAIPVLVKSLDIMYVEKIIIIFKAFDEFYKYMERYGGNDAKECIHMFELSNAVVIFEDLLKNPLYVNFSEIIKDSIDKLNELLDEFVPEEQKEIYEINRERKREFGDISDSEKLNGYDGYDEYKSDNGD